MEFGVFGISIGSSIFPYTRGFMDKDSIDVSTINIFRRVHTEENVTVSTQLDRLSPFKSPEGSKVGSRFVLESENPAILVLADIILLKIELSSIYIKKDCASNFTVENLKVIKRGVEISIHRQGTKCALRILWAISDIRVFMKDRAIILKV